MNGTALAVAGALLLAPALVGAQQAGQPAQCSDRDVIPYGDYELCFPTSMPAQYCVLSFDEGLDGRGKVLVLPMEHVDGKPYVQTPRALDPSGPLATLPAGGCAGLK